MLKVSKKASPGANLKPSNFACELDNAVNKVCLIYLNSCFDIIKDHSRFHPQKKINPNTQIHTRKRRVLKIRDGS